MNQEIDQDIDGTISVDDLKEVFNSLGNFFIDLR